MFVLGEWFWMETEGSRVEDRESKRLRLARSHPDDGSRQPSGMGRGCL